MSDPYRTAAVVETDEQRYRRLYLAYWGLGAMNAVGRTREELAKIDAQREKLLDQMILLGRELSARVYASMTQHSGAGNGQT